MSVTVGRVGVGSSCPGGRLGQFTGRVLEKGPTEHLPKGMVLVRYFYLSPLTKKFTCLWLCFYVPSVS